MFKIWPIVTHFTSTFYKTAQLSVNNFYWKLWYSVDVIGTATLINDSNLSGVTEATLLQTVTGKLITVNDTLSSLSSLFLKWQTLMLLILPSLSDISHLRGETFHLIKFVRHFLQVLSKKTKPTQMVLLNYEINFADLCVWLRL